MRSPVETTEKSLHYYVINLPKSAKRREHMREVLGPLFPPPIRFFYRGRGRGIISRGKIRRMRRYGSVRHGAWLCIKSPRRIQSNDTSQ